MSNHVIFGIPITQTKNSIVFQTPNERKKRAQTKYNTNGTSN